MTGLESTHPQQGGLQAALLIDADNFADPVAIDAAWAQLKSRAGRVSVCRAYGSSARLQSMATVWRTLGARTFPNLSIDKNTTDAALIADAVALHFQHGIRLFAIASGDADFAPLAVRLREWGCEVWCFSMEGTLFAGAGAYYDRVVSFASAAPIVVPTQMPPVQVAVLPTIRTKPEVKPQTIATPAALELAQLALFASTPEPISNSRPVAALRQTPSKPSTPLPEDVARILQAVPTLRQGPQSLSQIVPLLRQAGILGKNTKTQTFFARYPQYFQLLPTGQPNQLSYLAPAKGKKSERKSPTPTPLIGRLHPDGQ